MPQKAYSASGNQRPLNPHADIHNPPRQHLHSLQGKSPRAPVNAAPPRGNFPAPHLSRPMPTAPRTQASNHPASNAQSPNPPGPLLASVTTAPPGLMSSVYANNSAVTGTPSTSTPPTRPQGGMPPLEHNVRSRPMGVPLPLNPETRYVLGPPPETSGPPIRLAKVATIVMLPLSDDEEDEEPINPATATDKAAELPAVETFAESKASVKQSDLKPPAPTTPAHTEKEEHSRPPSILPGPIPSIKTHLESQTAPSSVSTAKAEPEVAPTNIREMKTSDERFAILEAENATLRASLAALKLQASKGPDAVKGEAQTNANPPSTTESAFQWFGIRTISTHSSTTDTTPISVISAPVIKEALRSPTATSEQSLDVTSSIGSLSFRGRENSPDWLAQTTLIENGLRVIVSRVAADATKADIREIFRGFDLLLIYFRVDPLTNEPSNHIFVDMLTRSEAKRAVELLDGRTLMGLKLMVRQQRFARSHQGSTC